MKHTLKKLDKSQVELNITVEPKEYEKDLKNAAVRISERAAIKGFRPGKAPYEMVKQQVGEMNILNEALDKIIQETFFLAVKEEELETVGMPKINLEKMVPGNDLVYTATVAILPSIKLADLTKTKATKKIKSVTDEQVNEVLDNLSKMQAKEVIKNGSANKTDLVVIDMDLFLDKVPVEGGQAKDYRVYLSEDHYIPGFADELVGLKKDDEKEFSLEFPKKYYQKILAGKKGDFKIKVKEVYERVFPEINDDFAKILGKKTVVELKELLKENLTHEAEHKAEQAFEIEIFDNLIADSEFSDLPEILIDSEKRKMYLELTHDLEKNGVSIEQYLADIKKKEEDLFKDFQTQAEKRAKASLISRQIAKEQKIEVSDKELEEEIKLMKNIYKDNPEYVENLKRPEVKDVIKNTLINKKVVVFLKEKASEKK